MRNGKVILLGLMALFAMSSVKAQESECGDKDASKLDSNKCRELLSVFHAYAKQKNYADAKAPWRQYYCGCPKQSGAQKWAYIDGTKILIADIKEARSEKDYDKMDAYHDTLMQLYDYWIDAYGDKSKVLGYKGLYTYAYQNHKVEQLEKAKEYFEESNQIDRDKISYITVKYYLSTLQRLTKYGDLDTAYWIDQYFDMSEVVNENMSDSGKYYAKWKDTQEDIDKMMEPVLQCDALLPIYKKKLAGEPTQEELSKMVELMERKGCTESPEYEKAASMLCDIAPSAICKSALAKLLYRQERYSEAKNYIQEAIELEKDAAKNSANQVTLADIYIKLGSTTAAMSAANKAISLDPNNGKAYLIKAGLYASMASNCSNDFDKKAAYWVVVDMYAKAKAVDPDVASTAQNGINKYSQYFPAQGEIFFQTLENGSKYTVDCLGVSTTVRPKAE